MRVAGWVLLVGGFFLCVSIAWAALGFLMMGFGLICLLVAEERRKRPSKSANARIDISNPQRELSQPEPGFLSLADHVNQQQDAISRRSDNGDDWNWLVQNDPNISRLVRALEPYGEKYVVDLATAYLDFNGTDDLPMILEHIVASAIRGAGLNAVGEIAIASNPPTALAHRERTRSSQVKRIRDLRGIRFVMKGKSALVKKVPRIDMDTEQRRLSAQFIGEADSVSFAAREPELKDRAGKFSAMGPVSKQAERATIFDDADDLTNLLTRLATKTGPSTQ